MACEIRYNTACIRQLENNVPALILRFGGVSASRPIWRLLPFLLLENSFIGKRTPLLLYVELINKETIGQKKFDSTSSSIAFFTTVTLC